MGRKKRKSITKNKRRRKTKENILENIHPEIRKSVWSVSFIGTAVIFILIAMGQAGPLGERVFSFLDKIFGLGYYLIPVASFLLAFSFVAPDKKRTWSLMGTGSLIFILSGLGFIHIISPGSGGLAGNVIGSLETPLGATASLVITAVLVIISFLIMLNRPISLSKIIKERSENNYDTTSEDEVVMDIKQMEGSEESESEEKKEIKEEEESKKNEDKKKEDSSNSDEDESIMTKLIKRKSKNDDDYNLPPLSLLNSRSDKPTIGDLRANANIIKRTLDSFNIPVEMGEINVGPTVTQYTLKPAEGVKLSKITALNQDLALALAAHPIRIEAPIPGKSLVGIEVPNKASVIVRLGNLMGSKEFKESDILNVVMGRDVSGKPVYVNIAKMPHLLIAGATGSGKSITIHSLIMSLIFKNSPQDLRMILIDPKRVELSIYEGIPHLISPVITQNKKALGALKWAVSEMEDRYETLLGAGVRDIQSYNASTESPLPYILVVIDELADLMASFGREVEGAIVRLAQMARATGIHLVVSTQRPSVEVITGLIKANITARVALQVASQIDSRTILDTAGAEKLLGSGDLLLISSESPKPKRIQGSFITDDEIKKTISYIKDNNKDYGKENDDEVDIENDKNDGKPDQINFEDFNGDEEDELYDEAVEVVREANRASASLLQRRLRVGYARAARLIDIMEERGIVGPHQGSSAREVYVDNE